MRVAYFVHDLNDAAVARRVAMLRDGGHDVRLAGFHRGQAWPSHGVSLGQTADGRLLARVLKIARHGLWPRELRRLVAGADVLLARNLETLVLAAAVRGKGQRLVYECLDLHRLLLGRGMASRMVRALERRAMRGVDMLLLSAPAFLDVHFRAAHNYRGDALVLENKVPGEQSAPPARLPAMPWAGKGEDTGPPWVIGWFGMLRCRKSLRCLAAIAAASEGRVQVLVAGRPSSAEFADFPAEVAALPGVRYLGPYAAEDVPALYRQIHFTWAIDYFEEGLNSRWLLPNRLYEGLAHGAVPLALASVATGEWLARYGAGVRLDDPLAQLPDYLAALDAGGFAALRAQIDHIPPEAIWLRPAERRAAIARITGDNAPTLHLHQEGASAWAC